MFEKLCGDIVGIWVIASLVGTLCLVGYSIFLGCLHKYVEVKNV